MSIAASVDQALVAALQSVPPVTDGMPEQVDLIRQTGDFAAVVSKPTGADWAGEGYILLGARRGATLS